MTTLILSRYNILVKGSRNPLLQEHDSVILGEISPHHEYYDSKSSTETPPSYNQLNYNENIERFFNSKPPVATMYGSDEENVNSSNDGGGELRSCNIVSFSSRARTSFARVCVSFCISFNFLMCLNYNLLTVKS